MKRNIWVICIVGLVIIFIYIGFFKILIDNNHIPFLQNMIVDSTGDILSKKGQIGDSFGVLNAFFSGLAFAGVIITLVLQQKEISEQKVLIKKQGFENTIINLFNYNNQLLERINYDGYEGIEAFKNILKKKENYQFHVVLIQKQYFGIGEAEINFLFDVYENIKLLIKNKIDIYDFIENEKNDENNYKLFTNIFYNNISSYEKEIIKFIIELKYNLIAQLEQLKKQHPNISNEIQEYYYSYNADGSGIIDSDFEKRRKLRNMDLFTNDEIIKISKIYSL